MSSISVLAASELKYSGPLNHEFTTAFLKTAFGYLNRCTENNKWRKRIFYTLTEMVQNTAEHMDIAFKDKMPKVDLLLQYGDEETVVRTANPIGEKDKLKLEERINFNSQLDKAALREQYKKALISNDSLGIIMIFFHDAQLDWQFEPIDEDYYQMTLKATIINESANH